jgi:hypothetical protein
MMIATSNRVAAVVLVAALACLHSALSLVVAP